MTKVIRIFMNPSTNDYTSRRSACDVLAVSPGLEPSYQREIRPIFGSPADPSRTGLINVRFTESNTLLK
jgi:hypothetical protein